MSPMVAIYSGAVQPIRTRRVGGLRFFWCGRVVFMMCVKRAAAKEVAA